MARAVGPRHDIGRKLSCQCPSWSAIRRRDSGAGREVLGDHFTELVVNLGKIAESGKRLQIKEASPFLFQDVIRLLVSDKNAPHYDLSRQHKVRRLPFVTHAAQINAA